MKMMLLGKNNFNCKIIRINEEEFIKDIKNQIMIICDKINKLKEKHDK